MDNQPKKPVFKFEAVGGVFKQDDPATDWKTFEYTKENFGLIPRSYPTDSAQDGSSPLWPRFVRYLSHLVATAPPDVRYKLFYLGRHGEGFHNVAEDFYGTQAWDDYWSKLDGNGTLFWSDAHLTEKGKGQARDAHAFMREQLSPAVRMPAPEKYYVSPMYRCLQTADLTWTGLELRQSQAAPFEPVIKELVREVLGEHTCDRRSSKSYIREHFPAWEIEEGFTEEDELWRADHRETWEEHDTRTRELLTDLFENGDGSVYLSLTTHSGSIASFLRVVEHREFKLPTGGMIPVLVKATKVAK